MKAVTMMHQDPSRKVFEGSGLAIINKNHESVTSLTMSKASKYDQRNSDLLVRKKSVSIVSQAKDQD